MQGMYFPSSLVQDELRPISWDVVLEVYLIMSSAPHFYLEKLRFVRVAGRLMATPRFASSPAHRFPPLSPSSPTCRRSSSRIVLRPSMGEAVRIQAAR